MRLFFTGFLLLAALVMSACRQDMHDQPKYKPLAATDFFGDGRSARPLIAGTVARGEAREDSLLYTGRVNGALGTVFPFPVTLDVLKRGRGRFDIYCTPCHDRTGGGDGMVVQRGFQRPPSFHIERLRQAPIGHFVDVMTSGFGVMQDYAAQVSPDDRWAIAAYIRALQRSRQATLAEVPPDKREMLEKGAE